MQGKRIYPTVGNSAFAPGEYGRYEGHWLAMTPNGIMGDLDAHDVTEHADGSITVSPSILVDQPWNGKTFHGYLEHGVWREC